MNKEKRFQILNNFVFVHASSGFSNCRSEAAILKEHFFQHAGEAEQGWHGRLAKSQVRSALAVT